MKIKYRKQICVIFFMFMFSFALCIFRTLDQFYLLFISYYLRKPNYIMRLNLLKTYDIFEYDDRL